jgi:poly-gamma-glutamate synthesis protein (capsule biosynthesis protein)
MANSQFELACAGDALITRKINDIDDKTDAVLDRVRESDVGVVNLEMLIHDFDGYPASNDVARFSGTYLRAPGWVLDELSESGFSLFAAANNHAGDFSHGGMLQTMRNLEQRDLAYAGLGRNLAAAQAPTYVDSPAGRVALVAACSTVTPGTEAGKRASEIGGRPGIAPLRLRTRYVLPETEVDALDRISRMLGLEEMKQEREESGLPAAYADDEGVFNFLHVSEGHDYSIEFEKGEEAHIYQKPYEKDVKAIQNQIQRARRQADQVIVSLHAHEGENGHYNDPSTAPFISEFARQCVDAGADAFVGHGPHTVRGIEIYNGAPLFYSLGNFIGQFEAIPKLPPEIYDRFDLGPEATPADVHEKILTKREYWESVVPICTFDSGSIEAIDLIPIEQGYDEEPPRHGLPRKAEGATAQRVVERIADRSERYGTRVLFEDGIGVVELE